MPLSAWIMLIFGAAVLYGGLAWCITIAARKKKRA
ncbi:MAG: MetS family NSS transporter small subunit [FCB group bacterium]|nr:MetS family NSS transporter small subunit [FCB group bacterium]